MRSSFYDDLGPRPRLDLIDVHALPRDIPGAVALLGCGGRGHPGLVAGGAAPEDLVEADVHIDPQIPVVDQRRYLQKRTVRQQHRVRTGCVDG
ncbi:MAG TPA: hypothetical protein VFG33_12850 [Kribbella sp.]|uniref:hypothetical protein n=1 Tax=Kribbella sp. TaxID=1871183 RepID=UPI002D770C79|nr:hypothetical protein [Kribbella sp.]HET6294266.1 hypothetical protein [Kribbella sp.]